MLAFRAFAFTIYTVNGRGYEPVFFAGDRVLVNRWSYGLRMGGNGLFSYGRICKQQISRDDLVAYEDPRDSSIVLFGRCRALPGDTVEHNGQLMIVPSVVNCADADYYWLQAVNPSHPDSRCFGVVSERRIIGRALFVVYHHTPELPLWKGYRSDRILIPCK